MVMVKENRTHEKHIVDEIIADCYGQGEQAMGWYYYLEENLNFPFIARCIMKKLTSPLKNKEIIEVIGMAPEYECQHEMLVNIRWQKDIMSVPLAQIEGIKVKNKTREAIENWHYWVKRGYKF